MCVDFLTGLGMIIAGLVMIDKEVDKFSNIPSFADSYVSIIGLAFPIFLSYCAAYTDLIACTATCLGSSNSPYSRGLMCY